MHKSVTRRVSHCSVRVADISSSVVLTGKLNSGEFTNTLLSLLWTDAAL